MDIKTYRKWLIVLQYYQKFLIDDFEINEIETTLELHLNEFIDVKLKDYIIAALQENEIQEKIEYIALSCEHIERLLEEKNNDNLFILC